MTRRPLSLLLALTLGVVFLVGRSPCEGFDPKNMDTSVSPCADFFEYAAGAWDTNSARNIPQLSQGGLSLPDRDYYLTQDASSKRLRAQYVEHVTRMFRLLGDGAATAGRNARTVLRLETRLARASMPLEETQDPIATYHKVSRKRLGTRASGFAWDAYFRGLGLDNLETLVIRQPAGVLRSLRLQGRRRDGARPPRSAADLVAWSACDPWLTPATLPFGWAR